MAYAFGKRLRAVRERKEISQKKFAELIGAGKTTVSNWENGLTRPDVDTLALICTVLEVSADEILDIHFPDHIFSVQERKVISQYRKKPELHNAVRILLEVE